MPERLYNACHYLQSLHCTEHALLLATVVLVFYGVSGGPFGMEEAVSAGGPLLTIVGLVVLPFAWSMPEALITAELATAFPEASGFVAWVAAAYGPYWGFMEG
jgi:amino acid transporter